MAERRAPTFRPMEPRPPLTTNAAPPLSGPQKNTRIPLPDHIAAGFSGDVVRVAAIWLPSALRRFSPHPVRGVEVLPQTSQAKQAPRRGKQPSEAVHPAQTHNAGRQFVPHHKALPQISFRPAQRPPVGPPAPIPQQSAQRRASSRQEPRGEVARCANNRLQWTPNSKWAPFKGAHSMPCGGSVSNSTARSNSIVQNLFRVQLI